MCDDLAVERLDVQFTPPPRQLTSSMLFQKLDTYVVNPVCNLNKVVAVSCTFHANRFVDTCRQISARRRQLELALLELPEVRFTTYNIHFKLTIFDFYYITFHL